MQWCLQKALSIRKLLLWNYFCPPMKLRECNVFMCVSFCPQRRSHVTITHDALDFTIQGPPLAQSPLYRDPSGPSTPAGDIWWPRPGTCSNLFTWRPPWCWLLVDGYWSMYSRQADSTHPIGTISCYFSVCILVKFHVRPYWAMQLHTYVCLDDLCDISVFTLLIWNLKLQITTLEYLRYSLIFIESWMISISSQVWHKQDFLLFKSFLLPLYLKRHDVSEMNTRQSPSCLVYRSE